MKISNVRSNFTSKILIYALSFLLAFPAYAADNAVTLTAGSGVTMRTKDVGSGVQSPYNILGDATGTSIYGTAGTANANVITVQGIASGVPQPVTLTSTTITGSVAVTGAFFQATQPVSIAGTVTITASNLNINNISGTVSLPTGASTAANQTTANSSLSTIATNTTNAATTTNQTVVQAPVAAATATATKSLLLGGQFDTTQKTLTNGQQAALSASARGALFVAVGADGFPITIASGGVASGAIASGAYASGSIGSGAIASGAVASGAYASGALASGSIAAGAMVDLLTMRGTVAAGTAAANALLTGAVYNSTPITLTNTQQAALQSDINGYLKVTAATLDPCQSVAKTSLAFSQGASAQIIAGTSAKKTYICSITLVAPDAEKISIVAGTGSVCASGTSAIIGATAAISGMSLAANGGFALGSGIATVASGSVNADNICLLQSGSGLNAGVLTYVQN